MIKHRLLALLCTTGILFTATPVVFANNISISVPSLTGQNSTNNYTMIRFDIAWDNSWRVSSGPSNWDAAWIFVKYRLKNQPLWHHATLNYTDGTGTGDGHTVPATATIRSRNDNGSGGAHGVLLYHNTDMVQGSVNYTGVQLRWNYGTDGVQDNDSVEIAVSGIEMVYVPQGGFSVGSGGTEISAFYTYPNTSIPYSINSEAPITVGTTPGNLYYAAGVASGGGDQTGIVPTAFPKGYNAFYCMKYEVSQQQYVSFLNKLTPAEATNRAYTGGGNRNGIGGTAGNYTTSNPHVACGNLSWNDLEAYLDWAALRPMTELEFEKACRGPFTGPANGYAWGNDQVAGSAYALNNAGATDESIATGYSTSAGNAAYLTTLGSIDGPLRGGVFAANAGNTGRVSAGATYYGIMEMSGNVWERCISVGSANQRQFDGAHGNGVLDVNGAADVSTWPGAFFTTGGFRGGPWNVSTPDLMAISSRYYAANVDQSNFMTFSGRGVRTAP